MAVPTVLPEARRIHSDVLARSPAGTSLDRTVWDRLLTQGYGKSHNQAHAITRTGEAAGLWMRHHDRITGRGRVEVYGPMLPLQTPTPH